MFICLVQTLMSSRAPSPCVVLCCLVGLCLVISNLVVSSCLGLELGLGLGLELQLGLGVMLWYVLWYVVFIIFHVLRCKNNSSLIIMAPSRKVFPLAFPPIPFPFLVLPFLSLLAWSCLVWPGLPYVVYLFLPSLVSILPVGSCLFVSGLYTIF
jgi:hypothetical protein